MGSATPPGAMYAFLRVSGQGDSLALAKRLVVDHGLGLAPGAAFGDEGEGWLRWCFASQDLGRLESGARRLGDWLVIRGRLDEISRARFWCAFEMIREADGALLVTARQSLALVQMPEGKPARLPAEWASRWG